jgi:hypothetical protein
MRWFARHHRREPLPVEPIDRLDPTTLEIISLDDEERLHGPPPERSLAGPREVGYASRLHDPTSLAGVWEALARS